jgi:subtilisin family serine protease
MKHYNFFILLTVLFLNGCNSSTSNNTTINDIYQNDQNTTTTNEENISNTNTGNDENISTIKDENSSGLNDDPFYIYQWYLKNQAIAPFAMSNTLIKNEDINISEVWKETLGDKNITVAIVDTGIDIKHNDIEVDLNKSYRYSDDSNDPSPTIAQLYNDSQGSAHGTACAGIVAAKSWNNKGIRGIAPNISLAGLNVFSNPTDASFADALIKDNIDISSNSWGGGGANTLFDDVTSLEAIKSGITYGRDKKGIIYVFASGNDNANANFQSILTSGYVIAVSAINGDGKTSSYSDYGCNILVCAPGGAYDPISEPAIVTTDITGLKYGMDNYQQHWEIKGNEDGNYTTLMNGTSASCPIVSGVVALMLSVNNNLTYEDVAYILATTARKNDPYSTSWNLNGANYLYSDKYGFGVVDAYKAVKKAKDFKNLKITSTSKLISPNKKINFLNSITLDIDITDNFKILDVFLTLNITQHQNQGKIKITLTSPLGTTSTLSYADTVLYDKFNPWKFLSVEMLDENSSGTWQLKLEDTVNGYNGILTDVNLTIKGYKE